MHPDLEHLVVADRYDRELRDLKKKKQSLLDILAKAEDRERTTAARVSDLEEETRANQARLRELAREVENYEARRRSATQVLERGTGDPDAAERQLVQVGEKLDALETEQLEAMERDEQLADDLVAARRDAEQAVAFARAEAAAHPPKMEALRARWNELLPEREATLAELDAHIADRYASLVARKHRAIAEIVNGSCAACQMVVRQQHIADLQRGLMQTCGGCGRWLLPPG